MQHKRSTDQLALQHFWRACSKYPRLFALSWLTPVSTIGSSVVIPFFIGKILGSLANPQANIKPYIIGLTIASAITVISNFIAFLNYFELQPRVMADLDSQSLDLLLKRGAQFHNNRISGKLVSDVSDYTSGFLQLSNAVFIDILPFLAIIVFGTILVFINSPFIGLVLLAMTSVAIFTTLRFRRHMKPFRIQRQKAGKAMIGHLADTIVNNQSVKTFASEDQEMHTHGQLASTLMNHRIRDWRAMAYDGSRRLLGLFLFEIVFVIAIVHEVHHNPALLATGIFAFSYTVMLTSRLFQIGNMMRQVEESLLQIGPMTEIMQEQIEVQDAPDATTLNVTSAAIDFKNVSFHYHDSSSKDAVFDGLDLRIRAGEKIGLVGPSGGGKTTLTKLLLRFEDITAGQILIDGQDIASVTQESLRKSIAYVSQEPLLFHRTIFENIAYGNNTASKAQVIEAARKASAHEFIQKLPQGYDTVVGERGVKLSGGQRQRVAIARAVLKEAPILVLDEATSALDSASEKLIQAALAELMKDKTALVIAHRLSTIQKMDQIVVLSDGTIAEEGTHKELLALEGTYAKLWAHQSGGFIED